MIRTLHALLMDEDGQGLAEYGLILGLVAAACVVATQGLGTKVGSTLTNIGGKLP